jgi:hypothetical protein
MSVESCIDGPQWIIEEGSLFVDLYLSIKYVEKQWQNCIITSY